MRTEAIMKFCPLLMLAVAAAARLAGAADEPASIHIQADQVRFRLSDMMVGANMEDLHYQMVGGFDSQMLHGESFFEHSPTELAPHFAQIAGFANTEGRWTAGNGILRVHLGGVKPTRWIDGFVQGGRELPPVRDKGEPKPAAADVEQAVAAAVGTIQQRIGTRLTSLAPAPADTVEISASFHFPAGSQNTASLLSHVDPNHSDSGWEWYAGYTVELNPLDGTVVLRVARKANSHDEAARAKVTIAAGKWIPVRLRVEAGKAIVYVDGEQVVTKELPHPLPLGLYGIVTRENIQVRDLSLISAAGRITPLPFAANLLLKQPGDALSLRWARVQTGTATGEFSFNPDGWHAGLRSQQVTFREGQGEFGMDNAGLKRWGLSVQGRRDYEGYLRVKTDKTTPIAVSLRTAEGAVLAEQVLTTTGGSGYERLAFRLAPKAAAKNARFAITLKQPGQMTVGYAFLQPGEWGRYKGLPVRKDLVDALIAQGIKLLRLNGGMIEVDGYRWANLHGPRDQRKPYNGFYDRYCSSGYGPVEHIAFCRAADIEPLIGLPMAQSPEEVADFVAYCNAPNGTPAGDRRKADGYAQPFLIRYLQIANESGVNANYAGYFQRVASAVWNVDPDITLVPAGNCYNFSGKENEAEMRRRLAPHLQITRFVHDNGKKLLWDFHAFNTGDDPGQALGGAVTGGVAFSQWLSRLAPECGVVPVACLEFNAGRFDFLRGLAHAVEMNVVARAGDRVRAVATPNVSQPWAVYQTDWKAVLWTQGNIYYTQDRVWFQPAYYVDQMIARNWAPDVVACQTQARERTLDVVAAKSGDGKHLVLRVVNLTDRPIPATLSISGFASASSASVQTLTGDLNGYNTLTAPTKYQPQTTTWSRQIAPKPDTYTFPAHSFTVIRIPGQ
jgi:alpha-L-arabinofuranosidase